MMESIDIRTLMREQTQQGANEMGNDIENLRSAVTEELKFLHEGIRSQVRTLKQVETQAKELRKALRNFPDGEQKDEYKTNLVLLQSIIDEQKGALKNLRKKSVEAKNRYLTIIDDIEQIEKRVRRMNPQAEEYKQQMLRIKTLRDTLFGIN